jgi:hypothetical protein
MELRRFRAYLGSPSGIYAFATLALGLTTAVLAYAMFLSLRARDIITVKEPLKVFDRENIYAGDHVTVELDYCKHYETQGTVGVFIASQGVMIPLGTSASLLPLGCHKIKLFHPLPAFVPPGYYALYITREYRLTFFEQRLYRLQSEPYEVKTR